MGKFVDNVMEDAPVSLHPVIPPIHPGSGPRTNLIGLDVESRSDEHALILGIETEKTPIRLLALSPPAAVLLIRKL